MKSLFLVDIFTCFTTFDWRTRKQRKLFNGQNGLNLQKCKLISNFNVERFLVLLFLRCYPVTNIAFLKNKIVFTFQRLYTGTRNTRFRTVPKLTWLTIASLNAKLALINKRINYQQKRVQRWTSDFYSLLTCANPRRNDRRLCFQLHTHNRKVNFRTKRLGDTRKNIRTGLWTPLLIRSALNNI